SRRILLSLALAALSLATGCNGGDSASKTAATTTPKGSFDFEAPFTDRLPAALDAGSPVRIAGVQVGTVTRVTRSTSGGVVSMRIRIEPPWPRQVGAWPVR